MKKSAFKEEIKGVAKMKEFITQLCIVVGIGIVAIASGVIVALLLDKIFIKIMELREDRKNKK